MEGISLSQIKEKMNLVSFTEGIDLSKRFVKIADVNRPALQLHGFYEYFDHERIQIIGMVEMAYLEKKTEAERESEKAWQQSKLTHVVDYILEQM